MEIEVYDEAAPIPKDVWEKYSKPMRAVIEQNLRASVIEGEFKEDKMTFELLEKCMKEVIQRPITPQPAFEMAMNPVDMDRIYDNLASDVNEAFIYGIAVRKNCYIPEGKLAVKSVSGWDFYNISGEIEEELKNG